MEKVLSNVILAPIHTTFFSGRGWIGLDLHMVKEAIEKKIDVKVTIIDFSTLTEKIEDLPENTAVIYTSSYSPSYRNYIKENVYFISRLRPDICLIPNLDMLYSHENKGFQELVKKRFKVNELGGFYFGDISDPFLQELTDFPYVVKLPEGAGSSNVALVKSFSQLRKYVSSKTKMNLINHIKILVKPLLVKDKSKLINYPKFLEVRTPFVIQNFISDLEYDYKILIFGYKYYVLKRYVRKNDFRASGSGKFSFEKPSLELLEYASNIFDRFEVPCISLDIAEKKKSFFLIEFQGIGFGSITLTKSEGYYMKNDIGEWHYISGKSILETEYGVSIADFLLKKLGTT